MKSSLVFIWLIIIMVSPRPIQSQDGVRQVFEKKLLASAEMMHSLTGEFKQIKSLDFMDETIISYGHFEYRNDSYILWQYESPYKYSIEISDGKLIMNDGRNHNEIDMNSTKSFRSMNDLFFKSFKGDVLESEDEFELEISETKDTYQVRLLPRHEGMASFVNEIYLIFSKATMLVSSLSLIESSGDRTELIFTNHKVND